MPVGAKSFSDAIRMGSEIYHSLKKLLQDKNLSTAVGDEGGFAPDLESDEQALEIITEAIKKAGYDTDTVKLAIDAAASEWANSKGGYDLLKRKENMTTDRLIDYWQQLWSDYPLISIEDGLDQRDFEGWKKLTDKIGKDKSKMMLVGDDLFVTNTERLRKGISMNAGNAILIKPNQIGTLTETLNVIRLAKESGYKVILSHRSGETTDTAIADIAAAVGSDLIKSGAPCRGERVAKYNRLSEIFS